MTIGKNERPVNIFDKAEEVAARLGIELPKTLNTDDRIYRTSTTDGRRGNKNGAIKLFSDGKGGHAWNWRSGEDELFFVSSRGTRLSDAERQEVAKRRTAAAEALERQYAEAAAKARRIWNAASPALPSHPYLERKGVLPYGVRERWGKLIIPVYGVDKDIISVQMIDPEGNKRFLKDAQNGGLFILNGSRHTGPVLIAEGFATAASLAMATFYTVVCAFNASMLGEAARRVLATSPERPVIICADNDHLAGKAEAMAHEAGAFFVIPDFEGFERGDKDTDFNDLHALGGFEEVGRQIRHAIKNGLAEEMSNQPAREETPKEGQMQGNSDSGGGARQYVNGVDLKPFEWQEPATMPPRSFIYGTHYIRRYVSITAAPGGVGKTALITVEALAMVTGRMLLDWRSHGKKRVWYIGEDDKTEIRRRFLAATKRYAINPDELDGLFISSFRDENLVIYDGAEGEQSQALGVRQKIISRARANKIDVIIGDPAIRTHAMPENDNVVMNAVMVQWINIAEQADVAVDLIMHSRKLTPGQPRSIDDIRGASAMKDASRSARLIVQMTEKEATTLNIDPEIAWRYIRVGSDKPNMAERAKDQWYHLDSVSLNNADPQHRDNIKSDSVQVVSLFKSKGIFASVSKSELDEIMRKIKTEEYRVDSQSPEWAGNMILEVCEKNPTADHERDWAKKVLWQWKKNGVISTVDKLDETRHKRKFYTMANWQFSTPIEKLSAEVFEGLEG